MTHSYKQPAYYLWLQGYNWFSAYNMCDKEQMNIICDVLHEKREQMALVTPNWARCSSQPLILAAAAASVIKWLATFRAGSRPCPQMVLWWCSQQTMYEPHMSLLRAASSARLNETAVYFIRFIPMCHEVPSCASYLKREISATSFLFYALVFANW